jgi:predicted oxidoreductase
MKKVIKRKDESKVTGIVYFCDVLKKEIVSKDFESLSGSEQECDICGSHGSVDFHVYNCECGGSHDIEIKSW